MKDCGASIINTDNAAAVISERCICWEISEFQSQNNGTKISERKVGRAREKLLCMTLCHRGGLQNTEEFTKCPVKTFEKLDTPKSMKGPVPCGWSSSRLVEMYTRGLLFWKRGWSQPALLQRARSSARYWAYQHFATVVHAEVSVVIAGHLRQQTLLPRHRDVTITWHPMQGLAYNTIHYSFTSQLTLY